MSEPSGESTGLPTYGPTNDPAARIAGVGCTPGGPHYHANGERCVCGAVEGYVMLTVSQHRALLAEVGRIGAERDDYHRRFSSVLKEHHEFMNDMLAALDPEIDEDGEFILDQIVAAAGKARTERDVLAAEVAELRDACFVVTDEYNHGVSRHCRLCGALVESEDDEHKPDCILARPSSGRGAAILAAGTRMAEALPTAQGYLCTETCGPHDLHSDECVVASTALDAWRALGLAAGDGDAGE